MNDLIFSLNATLPVFFLMVVGYILNKIGIFDDTLASKVNTFVFKIPLPFLLFNQLAQTDFIKSWDSKFVLFCFIATLLSIVIVSLISLLLKNKKERGEFIQGSYRSSAALLGIAYIENIYGKASYAPLMIIGAVPLYNIMAVVVLSLSAHNKLDKEVLKKTLIGIIKNPIIIGIIIGIIYSLLKLPMPYILNKVTEQIGDLSSPLGLMAMGASIDLSKVKGKIKVSLLAVFIKLIALELLWIPLACQIGFEKEKLIAIVIMLGSATTVSSYVMAKNMGHEGIITSNIVVLTTILSGFTLTFWIYILHIFRFI